MGSNAVVRVEIALLVFTLCGCKARPPDATRDPNAFDVDAKGAPAVIDQSWTLQGNGQTIGTIMGAVRCGDILLLSDSQGLIRRLNLVSGRSETSIGEGRENAAIGVDCGTGVVYSLGSVGFGKSSRGRRELSALDMNTGSQRQSSAVELMMLPATTAVIANDKFIVGGTWMPMPGAAYQHPPAATFFSDKKIGFQVELASGESRPVFDPFEPSCRGAGRCVGGSLSRVTGEPTVAWIATQPASSEIGLYDATPRLVRRVNVTSPMFKSDGRTVATLDAESSVRWSVSNSLVRSADLFGSDVVATIHELTKLPDNWVFGQAVDFDWWMNLHSLSGRRLVSDIRLPGMPIGHDETHVYAIDYGAGGRTAAPGSVKVLRIPVSAGLSGFKH